jgi:hypothetical protein
MERKRNTFSRRENGGMKSQVPEGVQREDDTKTTLNYTVTRRHRKVKLKQEAVITTLMKTVMIIMNMAFIKLSRNGMQRK